MKVNVTIACEDPADFTTLMRNLEEMGRTWRMRVVTEPEEIHLAGMLVIEETR